MSEVMCKEQVWHQSGQWGRQHRCTRKAWKDGYCKQHHPDSVKERNKKSIEKYRKQQEYRLEHSPQALIEKANKENAALRTKLQQAEEERDRAMRAADGARERATRWQETAECEADGLEHWKSACESSKAALAAKEKELERYKWMIEPILAVNAAVTCTYPCVFEKACREAGRRLEGEGSPKVTESVTGEE